MTELTEHEGGDASARVRKHVAAFMAEEGFPADRAAVVEEMWEFAINIQKRCPAAYSVLMILIGAICEGSDLDLARSCINFGRHRREIAEAIADDVERQDRGKTP